MSDDTPNVWLKDFFVSVVFFGSPKFSSKQWCRSWSNWMQTLGKDTVKEHGFQYPYIADPCVLFSYRRFCAREMVGQMVQQSRDHHNGMFKPL